MTAAVVLESFARRAPRFVKTCRCGSMYDAAAWGRLRYVGSQSLDVPGLVLELRNCAGCDSTLAIERVSDEPVPDTLPDGARPPTAQRECRWCHDFFEVGPGDLHDDGFCSDECHSAYERDLAAYRAGGE